MLQGAIDLVLVPGSSLKLVPVINVCVVCLLGVICTLSYTKIAMIHLVIMSCLAVGLLASVNWVLYEFNRIKEAEKAGELSDTGPSTGSIADKKKKKGSVKKTD